MLKYFILSFVLLFMGFMGLFLTSRHIMLLLLSMELIFLAVNFNFMLFSIFLDDMIGQFFALCVMTVAAAESSIGLSILVIFYKLSGGISLDIINYLKG